MNISPARKGAFDILLRIERENAYSSFLLPVFEAGLTELDSSLCHELTLGTLRRQIYLDRLIDVLSKGKKVDIEVRIALRLALYQLNFLTKIPQYSAINESVNLVQRARKTSAKGFANAILRRASREKIDISYSDGIDRISVETSHPRWLIEKWISQFGVEETAKLGGINNKVPPLAFRFIGQPHDDTQRIVRRSENVETCFIADSGEARIYELAENGDAYIQDEASQMTAFAVEIPDGGRFLDVCAAPGGKTGAIALQNKERTRSIFAGDIHASRVEYLRGNCKRQGAVFVKIVQFDAESGLPFADGSFDSVLVDAPCSGTGTIRRNPEIRYSIKETDFAELAAKQLQILTNASKLASGGGSIVYSTCSLEVEENEEVCMAFLQENADFEKVIPNVPGKFHTNSGFARTLPQRDDMDGFFIAAFRRK